MSSPDRLGRSSSQRAPSLNHRKATPGDDSSESPQSAPKNLEEGNASAPSPSESAQHASKPKPVPTTRSALVKLVTTNWYVTDRVLWIGLVGNQHPLRNLIAWGYWDASITDLLLFSFLFGEGDADLSRTQSTRAFNLFLIAVPIGIALGVAKVGDVPMCVY